MKKIYTGTYCHGGADSLFAADFDEHTGRLSLAGSCAFVDNPSYLARGKGGLLYAVSETQDFMDHPNSGALAVLKDSGSAFSLLAAQPTLGAAPCHVLLSADESRLYVSNYMGGSLSTFVAAPQLHLTQTVQHRGSGPNRARQEGPHVHFCGFAGDRLYAVDLGLDVLKSYRTCENALVPDAASDIRLPKGSGPRHFVVSKLYPNTIFVLCELSNEVMMVDISQPGGTLLQTISTLPEPCESICAAIKQSDCGRFLFASNRGHDSLAVLSLAQDRREMALASVAKSEGKTPRDFCVLGGHLLVCNQDSDTITVFSFDTQTRQLTFTGERCRCPKPVCVIEA